ncbi:GldG family protein [Paenibacillus bovis]|uniref:ABC transporter n=1 Tax=Paenibacillus bovis TaxID=1616788 RepID=A0A172ZLK0_9BACL|nr:GldG family protein [Paenibacillus bovis]ANF98117.1 ABC transporter [Paenibacillus bovis]
MRNWIYRTNAIVISVAAIGIFIVLTLFLNSLGTFQVDLTKDRQNTLSDQTMTTLHNIKDPVEAMVFTNPGDAQVYTRQVTDLLNEYHKINSKLEVKEYGLLQNPELARQYGVTGSAVVFKHGEQTKLIPVESMFDFGTADGSTEQEAAGASYTFSGEQKLTSGLLALTSSKTYKAYLLNGHNEFNTSTLSVLAGELGSENITVSELSLAQQGAVPKDASVLMIVAPQTDLSDAETKVIRQYLDGGGKLFLSLGFNEKAKTSWTNLDSLMSTYGITDTHAVAVEPKDTSLYDPLTIVPEYGNHEITNKLAASDLYTIMSLSIALKQEGKAGWTVTPLLTSSSNSYGETDLSGLLESRTERSSNDLSGPFDLGYAVSSAKGEPKAVILGGSTFMMDQSISQQGNLDFVLNSVNNLVGNESQVTIRPQVEEKYKEVYLTMSQARTIFTVTVIVLPLLLVAIGVFLWWRRRRG